MAHVVAVEIPPESALTPWLAGADFHDAYEAPLWDATLSPTEIYLRAARATPKWVADLMTLRNRIVVWFGIFNVFSISENELVLGIDDNHLDVRVSIVKQAHSYVVSTIVHVHNWMGRLYMAPVGRIIRSSSAR